MTTTATTTNGSSNAEPVANEDPGRPPFQSATPSVASNKPEKLRKMLNVFAKRTSDLLANIASPGPLSSQSTRNPVLAQRNGAALPPPRLSASLSVENAGDNTATGISATLPSSKSLRRAMLGVLVLDEFVKELAAACLEHAVRRTD